MKILYLLPPSEGKNIGGVGGEESLSFSFQKPRSIAENVTEKDLKCSGERFKEGRELNRQLVTHSGILSPKPKGERSQNAPLRLKGSCPKDGGVNGEILPAISRYSGVMYNAINYSTMNERGKKYFDNNFLILSGMYGIVKPQDKIGNYKLPIGTKGLREFWGEEITEKLNSLGADIIVDLLPNSYKKMIDWKNITSKIVRIDFYSPHLGISSPLKERKATEEMQPLSPSKEKGFRIEGGKGSKKLTHGVKKVKGEFIHKLCEAGYKSPENFPGERVQISKNEYHISIMA